MSLSTAVGMVSESLRNLLLGEMTLHPAVSVTILAPDETGGERRINLFLYKVQENAVLKNMDWQVKRTTPNKLVPPPLSLNIFYLMTAYAQNDQQSGNSTAHQIFGEAMRVFYENAIVPQKYLANGLHSASEQIKITLNSLDMAELSTVWSTFTQPFRLSVLYEVSVVQLDMLPASERTMAPRVREVGVPGMMAPYMPPIVESISPTRGQGTCIITFQGKHLSGWKAYVIMGGQAVLDGATITGDTFQMTVPVNFQKGFQEIRVDISNLFQRIFFFEVY